MASVKFSIVLRVIYRNCYTLRNLIDEITADQRRPINF